MQDQCNLKDVNPKRRKILKNFVKALPFIGGGAFLYPLYKFTSFEENPKDSLIIPLSELTSSISKYPNVFIRKEDENIYVFNSKCTHLGCGLNIDDKNQKFVCPCHDSEFDFNGKRLKGPAKRDLDMLSFKIKDSLLYIG